MRPNLDNIIDLVTLVPLLGALGAAIAIVAVRKLSQTESTATLLTYQSLFIGTLTGISMFFFWRTPDIQGFILLFGLAVLASFGHWLGIIALRYVDAAVCGNMEYTKIIFAAIIGFIFFQEIPDNPTFIGSGLIMSASLYMYYRERRRLAG